MRLLYVSGTYAPKAWSGGELSAHTLLRTLKQLGLADIVAFTDHRGSIPEGLHEYEGISIRSSSHTNRKENLLRLIGEFSPDVIFTQPYWHDLALEIAKERRIPSVFRLPNVPCHIDLSESSRYAPTSIIAQTTRVQDYVRDRFFREADVLPAFIDLNRAKAQRSDEKKYITLFNPVQEKGGAIFREIAKEMKDRQFAVVPGWTSHRDKSGHFDIDVFKRSAESEGLTYNGDLPKEAVFDDLPNVTVLAPRDEVGEIYAQTRVLLVPSQWEEQFARVIYEACINAVPVIASSVGGIIEHSKNCAILVSDYSSPLAWLEQIEILDDPLVCSTQARRGKKWVEENYKLEKFAIEFIKAVKHRISILK